MTQEDKQLLLTDLSARLPYGVKGHLSGLDVRIEILGINGDDIFCKILSHKQELRRDIRYIKPYLRPISSMTEEEAKELLFVRLQAKYGTSCAYIKNFTKLNEVSFREKSPYEGSIAVWFSFENKIHNTSQIREYSKCEYLRQINDITLAEIDWLNKKMFDFRGLIPKGLALSTEKFNPYKD